MKLSIIIPVYNCASFLNDIISSLFNQKEVVLGNDFEVIAVNDGSTDGSFNILKQNECKGFLVINQPNRGVSSARNVGLKEATGEYVWFVDGDDCIDGNSVRIILNLISEKPVDAFTFGYKTIPEEYRYHSDKGNDIQNIEYLNKVNLGSVLTPWLLVVRRAHLVDNDIYFKEGVSYGEDTMWMVFVNAYPLKVIGISNVLYYYRQRGDSTVHVISESAQKKRLASMQLVALAYKEALSKKDRMMTSEGINSISMRLYWTIQNLLLWGLRHESDQSNIITFLEENSIRHYPILWSRLIASKSRAELKTNLLCLFFPCSLYYKLITLLLKIK